MPALVNPRAPNRMKLSDQQAELSRGRLPTTFKFRAVGSPPTTESIVNARKTAKGPKKPEESITVKYNGRVLDSRGKDSLVRGSRDRRSPMAASTPLKQVLEQIHHSINFAWLQSQIKDEEGQLPPGFLLQFVIKSVYTFG
jgi:hypothetical protein